MRQPVTDAAAIAVEVARIHALAPDGLRRTWRAVFGRTPPASLSTGLLARMIAWHIQERAIQGTEISYLIIEFILRVACCANATSTRTQRSGARLNLKTGVRWPGWLKRATLVKQAEFKIGHSSNGRGIEDRMDRFNVQPMGWLYEDPACRGRPVSDSRIRSVNIRPSVSVGPPAANGTIIVMGCDG
jgi:hypothetical protein